MPQRPTSLIGLLADAAQLLGEQAERRPADRTAEPVASGVQRPVPARLPRPDLLAGPGHGEALDRYIRHLDDSRTVALDALTHLRQLERAVAGGAADRTVLADMAELDMIELQAVVAKQALLVQLIAKLTRAMADEAAAIAANIKG